MVSDNKIEKFAAAAEHSRRRILITIETNTRTVIRSSEPWVGLFYCQTCECEVVDLPFGHAAAIFDICVSELELFREGGDLHTTAAGGLCAVSVAKYFGRGISFNNDQSQKKIT